MVLKAVNYDHMGMTETDETDDTTISQAGKGIEKSFPAQEHRFQMVLDELEYSKTP